jgi:hypothetical protein
LAAERPDVLARLDQIKHYLRYMQLKWQIDRTTDKQQLKELSLALFTHGYRTRYTYMNHYVAIRGWAGEAARVYEEPSWDPAAPGGGQPWAVEQPYTRQEIEAEFHEGLALFRPDPAIEQKQFSDDLVPVQFAAVGEPAESSQAYQWTLPYMLYSVEGEPLQLTLVAGTIAHYRNMAAARWSVKDAAGNTIAGDRLPLDGEPKPITVEVPGSGRYQLEVDAAGRPATVVLDTSRRVEHAGWMQPMYFYVPKGTSELQYYWLGQPHRVHGPDGQVLQEVTSSGAFVKVKVPDGADGKPWHLSQMMLGSLWFFNAPNYLAASPAALLVPKELVEQDDLQRAGR